MNERWLISFGWMIHNLVAHPIHEVMYWFGLGKLADRLHDATTPR